MTRWVSREYEGALAFLFIAISTVLPWGVSSASTGTTGTITGGYWWFGRALDVGKLPSLSGFYNLVDAIQLQETTAVYTGYLVWGGSTVVFIAAIILGIALFVREDQVCAAVPIHLIAGVLLFTSGAGFLVTNIWLIQNGIPGLYVPVGGVFQLVFGGVLLTNRIKSSAQFVTPGTAATSDTDVDPDPVSDSD